MTTTAGITESELQESIIAAAHLHGWVVAHFRPGRTASGWRTPVAADGIGWPDLILVRTRLVVAEIKSSTGRLRDEQRLWIHRLQAARVEVHVWTPSEWSDGTVTAVLTDRRCQ